MFKGKFLKQLISDELLREWLIPASIFAVLVVCYTLPVLKSIPAGTWGWDDWDQFTFFNMAPWITIREYHQFPFWNPYSNGGNVLLAHPFSPFLSPFYLIVLVFGPVAGFKIQIIIHLFIGLLGMYRLSRTLGLTLKASYLPAFLYMFSSNFAFRMNEGQMEWMGLAFLPWLIYFFERSMLNRRYVFGGILSLALIFLAGAVAPFYVSCTIFSLYAFFRSVQLKAISALINAGMIAIGAALLVSIRLIPLGNFVIKTGRPTELETLNLKALPHMFLGRNQVETLIDEFPGLRWHWHEYGSYIGILPIILTGLGIMLVGRRYFPWLLTGLVCFLIILGDQPVFSLWKFVHTLPLFNSQRVPSRFTVGFVIFISVFSGAALSWFEENFKKSPAGTIQRFFKVMVTFIPVLILVDLLVVNSPIIANTFNRIPPDIDRYSQFKQRYWEREKIYTYEEYEWERKSTLMVPTLLSNSGIIESYEVVAIPQGDLRIVGEQGYRGEYYLSNNSGQVSLDYFSPNKLIFDVNANAPEILVINQNYDPGWRVQIDDDSSQAVSFDGLLAAKISEGKHKVIFNYMAPGFAAGVAISILFILFLLAFYLNLLHRFKNFFR